MPTSNAVKAIDKIHLKLLIEEEIERNGAICSLNHIDVSYIIDMSELFNLSEFNGDINQWDVSNVYHMLWKFPDSQFNGDVSQWNTQNVRNISRMFLGSPFVGDLRTWARHKNNIGYAFDEHFSQYLSKRKSIEEREKLQAVFYQESSSQHHKTL